MSIKGKIIRSEIGRPKYELVMSNIIWMANNKEISNWSYNLILGTVENLILKGSDESAQYLEEAFENALKIRDGERKINLWD